MTYVYDRVIVISIAFVLDIILGDPVFLYHPVRIMGKMITHLEKLTRKHFTARKAGFVLVVMMVPVWFAVPAVFIMFFYSLNRIAGIAAESFICYQMIAVHDLYRESYRVYRALKDKDTELARKYVSMIVGRDTERLDECGIAKAAVETVAENTSDGIVAPLFYMAFGGGALAVCYKAINTMDSMVGYKNEKYIDFGFSAAKLDDAANYIPARLSAVLMIAAVYLLKYDYKNAWRIFKRDRYNHKSPNSAQTEAVCAGALGLKLAGDAWYFGKLYEKPYIGDFIKEAEPYDIVRADKLMVVTSVLMTALVIIIYAVILIVGV